jgi:putative transposase
MIDAVFAQLQPLLDTKTACELLGKSRATHYRRCRPTVSRPRRARRPANALSDAERERVLAVLRHDDFVDKAPAQVWATLLDEGQYLCSESTMYRILRAHGEVRERRAQATHPAKVKPELVATAAGQVFSWDITKLRGPGRGQYFHLYVMLDIFSRYVVGWTVAAAESAELATAFIENVTATHGLPHAIHADRGTSMTSKPVAQLLTDLGVARSHSRPRVSNDNPYSEAQFKTLKYCPAFPGRFGSLADARAFCQQFFNHYNHIHRHKALGLHTPASVHYDTAADIRAHTPHTPATPNGSADRQHHPAYPPRPGSTRNPTSPHTDRITSPCLTSLDSFRRRTGVYQDPHTCPDERHPNAGLKRTDRMVIFRSTGRHRYRRHLVSAGGRPPLLLRLSWHLR